MKRKRFTESQIAFALQQSDSGNYISGTVTEMVLLL
jgi:hypothetical protein